MQPTPDHPASMAPAAPAAPADPAAPAEPPPTEADALLAGLDTLERRPLVEHVEVFEQVHGRLQAALREIDNA